MARHKQGKRKQNRPLHQVQSEALPIEHYRFGSSFLQKVEEILGHGLPEHEDSKRAQIDPERFGWGNEFALLLTFYRDAAWRARAMPSPSGAAADLKDLAQILESLLQRLGASGQVHGIPAINDEVHARLAFGTVNGLHNGSLPSIRMSNFLHNLSTRALEIERKWEWRVGDSSDMHFAFLQADAIHAALELATIAIEVFPQTAFSILAKSAATTLVAAREAAKMQYTKPARPEIELVSRLGFLFEQLSGAQPVSLSSETFEKNGAWRQFLKMFEQSAGIRLSLRDVREGTKLFRVNRNART